MRSPEAHFSKAKGSLSLVQKYINHKLNIPREEESSWKLNDLLILNIYLDFFPLLFRKPVYSKKEKTQTLIIAVIQKKINAWDFF